MTKDSLHSSPKRTVLRVIGGTIVALTLITIIALTTLIIHQENLFQDTNNTNNPTSHGLIYNTYHHRNRYDAENGLTAVILLPFAITGAALNTIFH
jgi:hypothetical protein